MKCSYKNLLKMTRTLLCIAPMVSSSGIFLVTVRLRNGQLKKAVMNRSYFLLCVARCCCMRRVEFFDFVTKMFNSTREKREKKESQQHRRRRHPYQFNHNEELVTHRPLPHGHSATLENDAQFSISWRTGSSNQLQHASIRKIPQSG